MGAALNIDPTSVSAVRIVSSIEPSRPRATPTLAAIPDPVPHQPSVPPALSSEQMTMLRYAGMGDALRRLVGGERTLS